MKKSMLYTSIGYILCGLALVCFGIFGPKLTAEGFVFGFAGALLGPGLVMLYKYIHWTRPQHAPRYAERLQEERIKLQDERNIMLRDKSGRIAYLLTFALLSLLIVLFALCHVDQLLLLVLVGVWIFQYVCGLIVYRLLDKRL